MQASLDLPTEVPFPDETEASTPVKWSWQLQLALIGGLLLAMASIAIVAAISARQKSVDDATRDLVAFRGLNPTVQNRLDPRYADANGDLLADPPVAATDFLLPETLVLAHYLGDDEGRPRVDWKGLQSALSQALGRPVKVQAYLHTEDEIEAVAAGEIQLVAAHSAEIPCLVNTAGLVPFAELRSPDGADGNRLVIAVPPKSDATSLEDLRGKTLVCTEPDSITGYRAAIVAINQATGMRPNVDYQIYFSHKHERSVRGLTVGKFPFIALSNDVLDRMLKEERAKQSQIRVVYESQVLPRLTIGHIHRLAPELVEQVKQAILAFGNENAEREPPDAPFRFVRTDYNQEYDFVRRLDDAFRPRFGQIFQLGLGSL